MNNPGICAAILCGGEGSRMGGADKPLLKLGEMRLIERVIAAIAPQVSGIILCAARNFADYAAFGHRVVEDGAQAGRGPLAGLLAGLSAADSEDVICVPGDAPMLPDDLAARLVSARAQARTDIALVHDGAGPQPLCALLPRQLAPNLQAYLDGGGRTPREWLARYRSTFADFSKHPRWAWSLNTPEEWTAAEAWLREPA